MQDVTELYDDLVAIQRTAVVCHERISKESRDDLQVVIGRIKGKLRVALLALPEEERHDIMYELDAEDGQARRELEGLL